jgi:uncharacterized ParB-like nuclease family protein
MYLCRTGDVHRQFQRTIVPHLRFVDSENATAWKQRIFFLIGNCAQVSACARWRRSEKAAERVREAPWTRLVRCSIRCFQRSAINF